MRHLPHHRTAVVPALIHKIETRGDRCVWTRLSRLCVSSAATAGTLRYTRAALNSLIRPKLVSTIRPSLEQNDPVAVQRSDPFDGLLAVRAIACRETFALPLAA